MDAMDHFAFCAPDAAAADDREGWAEALIARAVPESELQFYTRRAMEESRLAKLAPTAAAAAAHAYLAAAYSARIALERQRELEFEELALSIS